jgi:hypothetical protein
MDGVKLANVEDLRQRTTLHEVVLLKVLSGRIHSSPYTEDHSLSTT